jgi:DNA-binding transcriptional LysR family regulator
LAQHNCLRFALDEVLYDRWAFPAQGKVVQVRGNRSSDDADLVRRWAVAGEGIAYKSRLDVTADLKAGRLRLLLPDVMGEEVPLQLVCMHRSQVTPIVIRLRDYLRAQYEQLCQTAP